jgi:hypothetical protein
MARQKYEDRISVVAVAIEYRWAEGRDERFAEIAAEFIRLKVDVIFTYGTPRPNWWRLHRTSSSPPVC